MEKVEWVLIDDLLARETAKGLGLKVKGTLGVIFEALRRELIDKRECELLLDAIVQDEEIWMSADLVRQVRGEIRRG